MYRQRRKKMNKRQLKIKSEHFNKIASSVKTSSIGNALLSAAGMGMAGAAVGGIAVGLAEEDPMRVKDSILEGMATGAVLGSGSTLAMKLLAPKAIGSSKSIKEIERFTKMTADDVSRGRYR